MKKFLLSIFAVMLAVFSVQAQSELIYTLTPAGGSNSGYAGDCDITIDDITWNLTGNSQMLPWRMGGKSLTNADRTLYSKTPMEGAVDKVVLTTGTASSITVNSAKLLVSTNSDFSSATTYTFTFKASTDIEIPVSAASGSYYKFVFNVTVSSTSNKFIQISGAKFYGTKDAGGGETPEPEPEEPKVGYTLITSINDLSAGDNVVIVATNANVALSTTQNSNNRGNASVTKSDNIVTFGDDVQVMTLEAGSVSGTFAFNTGEGYLYAASSGSNYLRTETVLSANSSWNITIASTGVATIKAQGSNTRNWLRYNSSNSIFSCYGSGQGDVSIYKLYEEGETPAETVDAPILPESTTFDGSYEVTITAGDGVVIYYTLDGNEPTKESTLYEGPFTITETTTVKAIAVKNELVSVPAEATYKLVKTLNNCTVAELMEAYASGDDIAEGATVVGYIVGAANNSLNNAEFGTTSVVSNILLADDPYETNVENCIPVEIKNDVRTALNLANNPGNYQRKVVLTGNVETYFSVAGLKNTSAYEFIEEEEPVAETWSSFYAAFPVAIPEGVEAYIVTAANAGYVTLTQIYNAVPANTGVILKGGSIEATYDNYYSGEVTEVTGNLLKGTMDNAYIEEEAYVLGKVDGVIGLYKALMTDGQWLNNANKAYLPASEVPAAAQGAANFSFRFEGEGTTGIENVEVENEVKAIYDLTGRRVEEITAPGIYIINGVKRVVR